MKLLIPVLLHVYNILSKIEYLLVLTTEALQLQLSRKFKQSDLVLYYHENLCVRDKEKAVYEYIFLFSSFKLCLVYAQILKNFICKDYAY